MDLESKQIFYHDKEQDELVCHKQLGPWMLAYETKFYCVMAVITVETMKQKLFPLVTLTVKP